MPYKYCINSLTGHCWNSSHKNRNLQKNSMTMQKLHPIHCCFSRFCLFQSPGYIYFLFPSRVRVTTNALSMTNNANEKAFHMYPFAVFVFRWTVLLRLPSLLFALLPIEGVPEPRSSFHMYPFAVFVFRWTVLLRLPSLLFALLPIEGVPEPRSSLCWSVVPVWSI